MKEKIKKIGKKIGIYLAVLGAGLGSVNAEAKEEKYLTLVGEPKAVVGRETYAHPSRLFTLIEKDNQKSDPELEKNPIIVYLDKGHKCIPALEAMIESEINDGDDETIEIKGYFSQRDLKYNFDVFRMISAKVGGYTFDFTGRHCKIIYDEGRK